MLRRCLIAAFVLVGAAFAQQQVDPQNIYERLICVVPMVGSGTSQDPQRPMFTPVPGQRAPSREGIIAYIAQVSDDGKFALVEFVALDRAAFQPILEAKHPQVKVFHKGKAKRADIEREFRKYRKDFNIERFGVSAS